jgi:hypothetical protein
MNKNSGINCSPCITYFIHTSPQNKDSRDEKHIVFHLFVPTVNIIQDSLMGTLDFHTLIGKHCMLPLENRRA